MLGEEHILWDVVEEHLDEAEFLVEQWLGARASPDYTLEELRDGPESRLVAHVDGLVVNGPLALQKVAWPIVEDGEEPTAVAAAAMAVLESGDFRVLDALDEDGEADEDDPEGAGEETDDTDPDDTAASTELDDQAREFLANAPPLPPPEDGEDREGEGDDDDDEADDEGTSDAETSPPPPPQDTDEHAAPPRAQGLSLALALCTHPELGDHLRGRVAGAEGPTLALLLQACADRGLDPGAGLDRALMMEEPEILVPAARAAAFGSRHRLLAPVEALLRHPALVVRLAALDTAMGWGSGSAWEMVTHLYAQPGGRSAMVWAATLGDDRHARALVRLLDDDALRGDALWALGFSGRVPAVEACLEHLDSEDETTRRLAGEAVAAIVGLDPEDESLWDDGVSDEPEPGLEGDGPDEDEDDLDAELAPTPEDELPLPIAEAIRAWWAEHQGAFTSGQRYLLGKPIGKEGPGWTLPRLSCRRVDVVAREVAARSHGAGHWPMRAPAPRHLQVADALAQLGAQAGVMKGGAR